MVIDVAIHHLTHQRVELTEVAEHHMTTEIPGEAGGIDHRGGEAAGVFRLFEGSASCDDPGDRARVRTPDRTAPPR